MTTLVIYREKTIQKHSFSTEGIISIVMLQYIYIKCQHCFMNSNKHWLNLVPLAAVFDLQRETLFAFLKNLLNFYVFFHFEFCWWHSYHQKVWRFSFSNFHSTLPFWQPSFPWRDFFRYMKMSIWHSSYKYSILKNQKEKVTSFGSYSFGTH